jgi:hypothetical protein
MKQVILAVVLAITLGAVFIATSGISAADPKQCARADNPDGNVP